jgi:hypothetical protein
MARAQMHVARIELGQMRDEPSHGVALTRSQVLHARQELNIGEATQGIENVILHDCL